MLRDGDEAAHAERVEAAPEETEAEAEGSSGAGDGEAVGEDCG